MCVWGGGGCTDGVKFKGTEVSGLKDSSQQRGTTSFPGGASIRSAPTPPSSYLHGAGACASGGGDNEAQHGHA